MDEMHDEFFGHDEKFNWFIDHIDIIQIIEWDWGAWVRSQLFLTT